MMYGVKYQSAIKALSSTVAIVFVSACASTGASLPEQPVTSELAPLSLPEFKVGDRRAFRDELNDKDGFWEITKVNDDGGINAKMDNGCEWTESSAWFAGDGDWNNCGSGAWSSGKGELLESSGSLWPLTVGGTANYEFTQTNSAGEVAKHKRKCDVSGANIETGKGAMDTYKVTCVDNSGSRKSVRTWYFSPEYDQVRFMRWKGDGSGMRINHNYLPAI